MKYRITMKDPDGVCDSLREAAEDAPQLKGLDPEDVDTVRDAIERRMRDGLSRWFEYGEYLEVEIDTAAGTCVVVER